MMQALIMSKMPSEKTEKTEKAARKKGSSLRAIKRILPYFAHEKGVVCFDLFCAAMTTVCELVLPMLIRKITGSATAGTLSAKLILIIGGSYIVLRIIDALANYYMSSIGHIMGTRIETQLRADLFAHLQKLSFSYYNETKIGVLMSRITNDLFEVTEFAHHCPEEFFIFFIKFVGAFTILCTINIPLTLIVFAMLPPMIICMYRFNRRMKNGFAESRRRTGELNASIEDSLLGIHVVKSFTGEEKEKKKFEKGNLAFFDIKKTVYQIMGSFHGVSRLFDGLMYILTVIAGSFFILGGQIDAADLIAYLLYVTTLFASIRSILQFTEQFYKGITGIDRFIEIMDTEPEITDSEQARELTVSEGAIEFRDITFGYNDNGAKVLSHFNLSVRPGENLAVVGPSGAGKTTLCSLLPRFYEVTDGEILIDGTPIKSVTQNSLRKNIGIVEQDVYLFGGTIKENIAYGNPDATDEAIEEAAKKADAYEFITSLPQGFDTYCGERGIKLSGGQKQRISIARVFLKNPPILILDEATSALDNESERLVRASLYALAQGRTTITIAHRLTTIKNADRIILLTENGIEEEGTHDELMSRNGKYADMYKLYSSD